MADRHVIHVSMHSYSRFTFRSHISHTVGKQSLQSITIDFSGLELDLMDLTHSRREPWCMTSSAILDRSAATMLYTALATRIRHNGTSSRLLRIDMLIHLSQVCHQQQQHYPRAAHRAEPIPTAVRNRKHFKTTGMLNQVLVRFQSVVLPSTISNSAARRGR